VLFEAKKAEVVSRPPQSQGAKRLKIDTPPNGGKGRRGKGGKGRGGKRVREFPGNLILCL
jgi:hypothetical protein